jgi:ATP-binding cassette subfamily G (WHITE) protein 2
MQDDLLRAELTVEETLWYSAQLKLSNKNIDTASFGSKYSHHQLTASNVLERMDYVLNLMGISHVKLVKVGDTINKGISGGERKRLCIAMELLTDPVLLFLDEPTSGLDSGTSLKVCTALKALTDSGKCTVVCTIHQPQEKIFKLFDNLILMKAGKVVYMGATHKAIPYLESGGMPCPADVNPADHVLNVLAIPEDELVGSSKSGFEKLVLKSEIDLAIGSDLPFEHEWVHRTWYDQVKTLTNRNWLIHFRNYNIIILNLFCLVILSIFISCGAWHQIGNDQKSMDFREPSLFFGNSFLLHKHFLLIPCIQSLSQSFLI